MCDGAAVEPTLDTVLCFIVELDMHELQLGLKARDEH